MKKLLTLIALIGTCIPAIQGMETNVPADVQKKYDNLKVLIQNADAEGFKSTFDALESVEKTSLGLGLEQSVAETKAMIVKEIETLSNDNKDCSRIIRGDLIAKGGLAVISGSYAALLMCRGLYNIIYPSKREEIEAYLEPILNGLNFYLNEKVTIEKPEEAIKPAFGVWAVIFFAAAYKALPYGYKNIKVGWNYKQYLQDQLTNLDAIVAHIAQAKAN